MPTICNLKLVDMVLFKKHGQKVEIVRFRCGKTMIKLLGFDLFLYTLLLDPLTRNMNS